MCCYYFRCLWWKDKKSCQADDEANKGEENTGEYSLRQWANDESSKATSKRPQSSQDSFVSWCYYQKSLFSQPFVVSMQVSSSSPLWRERTVLCCVLMALVNLTCIHITASCTLARSSFFYHVLYSSSSSLILFLFFFLLLCFLSLSLSLQNLKSERPLKQGLPTCISSNPSLEV